MTNQTNVPQGANAPSLSLDPIIWASTHPDAELLTAWQEYVRVFGEYNALPPMTMAEIAPWDNLLNTLSERVETIPARTMEGMHVKLRYLLESTEEKRLVGRVVICGDPVTEEFLNRVNRDFRPKMLWQMIQDTKPGSFPTAPGPAKGVASTDTPGGDGAALADSTIIPALGMTFAEAEAYVQARYGQSGLESEEEEAFNAHTANVETHILITPPGTNADMLVKARLVSSYLEHSKGKNLDLCVKQVLAFMTTQVSKGVNDAHALADPDAALLAAFRAYRNSMHDGDEDAALQRERDTGKVMDSTPARSLAGALVLLGRYLGDGDLGVEEMPAPAALKATIDLMPPEVRDVVEDVVEKAEGLANEHFRATARWREALAERNRLEWKLKALTTLSSPVRVLIRELDRGWDAADEADQRALSAHAAKDIAGHGRAERQYDEADRRIYALQSALAHLPADTPLDAVVKLVVAEPSLSIVVDQLECLAQENGDWVGTATFARESLSTLQTSVPLLVQALGLNLREDGLRRYMWPDHCLDVGDGKAPISAAA